MICTHLFLGIFFSLTLNSNDVLGAAVASQSGTENAPDIVH